MLRKSGDLLVPAIRTVVQSSRNQSVVAGPPKNHISGAEKWILGGGMCVGMLAVPAWVLYKIPRWRGVKD